VIPFADCHTRQLPRLTAGPFRYGIHAVSYLRAARQFTERPLKQAVISASALTLLYPQQGIAQYSRETFLDDLTEEAQRDIRESSEQGADCVQIDFKLDPSGSLLSAFVELNNRGLEHFASGPRKDRRAQTWIMSTSYPFCFNSKSGVSTLNWPVNVTERRSSRKPERS
jgi:5-methyltetrahydropteroyltriglutamate--homocysteine methyltransferase